MVKTRDTTSFYNDVKVYLPPYEWPDVNMLSSVVDIKTEVDEKQAAEAGLAVGGKKKYQPSETYYQTPRPDLNVE